MVLYDHHGVYRSADLESFWPNRPILPNGFNPSGAKLRSDEEDRWAASSERTGEWSHQLMGIWPTNT